MLQLMSARNGDKLGVGLKVTKANDIPPQPVMVMAYEFDEQGLSAAYRAKMSDFPEMMGQQDMSLADELEDWPLDEAGNATATKAANALGKNRSLRSSTLNTDSRFTVAKKEGRDVLYAVKRNRS